MFRDLLEDLDNYAPEAGRYLDVPFVPTDEEAVEAMLTLAKVGPKDVIYDLGSGDGRILIAAAQKWNARGIGVEIDPLRIAEAMENAGWAGVEYLVDFVEDDIFTADIREATIVTLYLLESVNAQLRPRLLKELRPGARIVSHAFNMGDWKPDDWIKLNGAMIFKWIVPARVAGNWQWTGPDGERYRISLQQKYQEVSGEFWRGDRQLLLDSAELRGARLDLYLTESETAAPERFRLKFVNNRLHTVATRKKRS